MSLGLICTQLAKMNPGKISIPVNECSSCPNTSVCLSSAPLLFLEALADRFEDAVPVRLCYQQLQPVLLRAFASTLQRIRGLI